ncbi:MAG TPA: YlmC/YmxH family sporulation protein [Tissierellales bacterium]|nr:YlmC/YmxH family sporulation protein [Tissierellales bacterium]
MLGISDIKTKEVINIATGERLGYVYDFEIDMEKGKITSFVLPSNTKGLGIFSKPNDIIIYWEDIIKIGADTILIDISEEI